MEESITDQQSLPALGTWVSMNSEPVIEVLDGAGYDFVVLDCQHGALSEADAVAILRKLSGASSDIIVRVSTNTPALIGKVLDAGADGVIIPMINTAEEAAAAVAACCYHPDGVRSFGPLRHDLPSSPQVLADRVSCFVMIETPQAIDNAAEICAVSGLAGVVVGPGDLSVGLGMDPLDGFTTDQLFEPLSRIRAACEQGGIPLGLVSGDPTAVEKWVGQGVQWLVVSLDAALFPAAAKDALETARAGATIAA